MLPLRFCILLVTVVIAGANEDSNSEVLDAGFYGLDDPNEPETIEIVVPTETLPADDGSQPTSPPEPDSESENRRGGRRHHHHHNRGRHHHRHRPHGNGENERRPYHHGMHRGWSANWTDEEKLTHVCTKLQAGDQLQDREVTTSGLRGGSNGRRRHGAFHWKLRALNETARQTVIDLWNTRKQEMLRCCNEESLESKMQCVATAKASRYDRVCRGEEPLCFWAALMPSRPDATSSTPAPDSRTGSATDTTSRCCALEGTQRVQCFTEAKNNYRQRMHERMQDRNSNWSRARVMHHGNPNRRRGQQQESA